MFLMLSACARPAVEGVSPTPTPSGTPTATPTPASLCAVDPMPSFAPWIDGADCGTESKIQVQQYGENTWILRESMCTNFEGPFLYLLFGQDKVLLEDTGAGPIDLKPTVDSIVQQWLTAHGKSSIELVVVNSHAHGDHISGNGQFAGQPDTVVVGTTVSQVQSFFGITSWPTQIVSYDLGGRVIDVIPIPGHQAAHIALYDHETGNLLTGDTLYPGRLYVSDFPSYVDSIQRMVDFTAGKDVCHVLGTHIEMTSTAGQDFAYQSTYHPGEHLLPLTRAHLLELNDAVHAMAGNPVQQAHDDFIIVP